MSKFLIMYTQESCMTDECHGRDIRHREDIVVANSKEEARTKWEATAPKYAYFDRAVEIANG